MTQEEKQLLLVDLCARLPYGVKVLSPWEKDGPCELSKIDLISNRQIRVFEDWFSVEDVRPYLRPLSSMTKKEYKELEQVLEIELNYLESDEVGHTVNSVASSSFEIDFYNKNHFDYRGLIEKGLALEAPEGMYKTE